MEKTPDTLGNSTQEQDRLRPIALWAADCAEQALPLFETRHPTDPRPRQAIEASRAFGQGQKRDHNLRRLALAALKAAQNTDEPSKYAARAATLAASVAYTHTDLQTGLQGIRQARHILGPTVYATLALETASNNAPQIGDQALQRAIQTAPPEARTLLKHLPPQPQEKSRSKKSQRLNELFFNLDLALRLDSA